MTMYLRKYSTCSTSLGDMSSASEMRDGTPLKYQMWETGEASSM